MTKFTKTVFGGLGGIMLLGIAIYLYSPVKEYFYPEPTPYDLTKESIKDLPKVNFSQSGTLNKIESSNSWNFIYDNEGQKTEVSLSVSPRTVCLQKEVQIKCSEISIEDGAVVNVDGVLTSSNVDTVKIQKVY